MCKTGDCISLKLRCDGFNDCGDNSDEDNCQFFKSRRCAMENKNCTDLSQKKSECSFGSCSQHCIEKKNSFSCQCVKGYKLIFESDHVLKVQEESKEKFKNHKATSSEKKDAYENNLGQKSSEPLELSRTCKAVGTESSLILVSEAEVRLVSPYKSHGSEKQFNYGHSQFKIQSLDILYNDSETFVFFSDYFNKKIMRITINRNDLTNRRDKREISEFDFGVCDDGNFTSVHSLKSLSMKYDGGKSRLLDISMNSKSLENFVYKTKPCKYKKNLRIKREYMEDMKYDYPKTIVEELHNPKAIAVDWVVGRLYFMDKNPYEKSAVIIVSTLLGRKKTTIIKNNLIEPFDLAVDPKHGFLFFTDCSVKFPKIERSFMDGTLRKLIIVENIICPSGLSLDYPTSTLYFVDTKLKTLESISVNGDNRRVIKAFFKESFRPHRVEIFEDFAYISLYQDENVLRINKFGRGEVKSIVQGTRSRISDIVIVQENKQDRDFVNPCQFNSCHESSLCVIGSSNIKTNVIKKSCICPDGLQKAVLSNSTVRTVSMLCNILKLIYTLYTILNQNFNI